MSLEEQYHAAAMTALEQYKIIMRECREPEQEPIDLLRLFLSCALSDQDWLDVEPFIDEVTKQLAAAQADALEQARIVGMGGDREVALRQKLEIVSSLLREASWSMSYGHWSSEFRARVENALKAKAPK